MNILRNMNKNLINTLILISYSIIAVNCNLNKNISKMNNNHFTKKQNIGSKPVNQNDENGITMNEILNPLLKSINIGKKEDDNVNEKWLNYILKSDKISQKEKIKKMEFIDQVKIGKNDAYLLGPGDLYSGLISDLPLSKLKYNKTFS